MEGEWKEPGFGRHDESPVDGRSLGRIPMIELEVARRAVRFAKAEAAAWAVLDLDQRRQRVSECLEGLREYRELMHAVLAQVLAGNASISKTPTDGGLYAL